MNRTLQKILRKVESVQLGLLKCNIEDEKLLLHARAGTTEDLVHCIVPNERSERSSLKSQNVNFIQRDKENYLYITCKVKDEVVHNQATIISMEVLKACWFTRKSNGAVSWLKEKYIYHAIPAEIDLAS